ncbi:MAG: cache domain-containing protein [Campylobacterota bacterium]|nr:cache domain-containing protein [Campylobacterota bacterium]
MLKLNEKNIGKFNLLSTLLILILFAFAVIYLSVISKKDDFNILKQEIKAKFIKEKKEEIKFRVDNTNQLIIQNASETTHILKAAIKERVDNAYKIVMKIYNDNKDNKTKQDIINIIKETLRPIRFDDGKGYFFMVDMKGNEILYPVAPHFENTNVFNLQDAHGKFVIQDEIDIVKNMNEGYIEDHWIKPDEENKKMAYPKLTFVKAIAELDIYMGTGMYIDDANKKDKNYIKKLITELNKQNKTEYIIISKLLNIDGGDEFAKIIVHPAATLGKVIGDEKKDLYGKDYRKEYLKGLRENGSTYLKYSYIHPKTKIEMSKISYFVLNKEWNWIIGVGFHDDIIDQEIGAWQENMDQLIKNNIYQHIILLIVFTIILFLIVYLINTFTSNIILNYKKSVDQKQDELNTINNNLAIRIKEEVAKSTQQEKILQEQAKMVAMGEMIGNIAHQWRQPLSIISTAATGMKVKKEYGISDEKEELKMLDSINESAQHLSQTIDDFRDFLKGDSAKKSFFINDIIEKTFIIEEAVIKNNNIDIIKDLDDDIEIFNLPHGLLQSCVNIINNAKDVLKDLDDKDRYIFITTKILSNKIKIEIKDTGGGIPDDIITKIFEPYFTTKHKSQGTGLGLHMTYNIINQNMGGTISVRNENFEYKDESYTGAIFTITLPIEKQKEK